MKPPNWDRIQEIFNAALARPPSERSAFVATACVGDPDLAREINEYLKAVNSAGILDSPVIQISLLPENLVGITVGGRYVVKSELRHGGMSQVYLAQDLNLQKPVVIKILSDALAQDSYARQKFAQEVEALRRVDRHPGVVRVSDRGELADDRPYIVMDYVEGETLRPQIQGPGMDLKRAASIVKQIGEALEHVHERDIFHRDLKPENIMLERGTDSVVLIDFGIAKVKNSAVAPSTVNSVSPGTLRYMSPEQLRGEEITAASDIYSMGLVAYEMLTGRPAFDPASASQLPHLQRKGVRKKLRHLRENLSPKARAIIVRATSFESTARYKSAKQFGDDLANALLEHAPTRSPLGKWPAVVAGALAVALLSYGIYIYFSSTKPLVPNGFNYWLMVQERDGKGQPFKSNGDETFGNGDKFQLNVLSLKPGYLYIFHEGPHQPGSLSFKMIYPNKATNNGSASLGANQTVQSDWIPFRGPAGAENFWIVWAASPINELESVKNDAFAHPQAGLTDPNLVRVKEFLKSMEAKVGARTREFKAGYTAVRKESDIVITLAQFQHQ